LLMALTKLVILRRRGSAVSKDAGRRSRRFVPEWPLAKDAQQISRDGPWRH